MCTGLKVNTLYAKGLAGDVKSSAVCLFVYVYGSVEKLVRMPAAFFGVITLSCFVTVNKRHYFKRCYELNLML